MNSRSCLGQASSVLRCWPLLLCAFLQAGCGKEEIRVYRVPKEKPMPAPAAAAAAEQPAAPAVHWKTPATWKEQTAGGMRSARFSVSGKDGQEADVSIIALPGISAGKVDVVNLWREQVHLAPLKADDDLSNLFEKVTIGPGEAELFDMVSDDLLVQGKFKQRILVAMFRQDSTTWFFKMVGEDGLVREQKPTFLTFLKSITFEQGKAEPPTPVAAAESDAKPAWEVPSGWAEQPAGQMLLAKFLLSGSGEAKAEVTVSVFPGDTGGLLANVNRWRGQVGLGPVAQPELGKLASLDVMGGRATLVDVSGISPKSGQKARLVGAVVPREGRTWFYKLLGDEQIVAQQQAAFLKFIQTVRYTNAG